MPESLFCPSNQVQKTSDESLIDAEELAKARRNAETLRRISSPVFIGTNRIPADLLPGDRPVLFVGNHTIFGFFDLPFFIEHFLQERNVLVRGLAHPILFNRTGSDQNDMTKKKEVEERKARLSSTVGNSKDISHPTKNRTSLLSFVYRISISFFPSPGCTIIDEERTATITSTSHPPLECFSSQILLPLPLALLCSHHCALISLLPRVLKRG